MAPRVTTANPIEKYRIALSFTNNEKRVIDIEPYLTFGVFQKLRHMEMFRQVRVAFGTLEWPCGVDIDPDFVWEKSVPVESVNAL